MTEPMEPSTSSSLVRDPKIVTHPCREPFEHNLLLIPRLIFSDLAQTLISLKQKLLDLSTNYRVHSMAISDSLQISVEHARLLLDTLSPVLHSDAEPLVVAKLNEIDTTRRGKSKTITILKSWSGRIWLEPFVVKAPTEYSLERLQPPL